MPQNAWKIDNSPLIAENELLCDVEQLNIDSASFRQIDEFCEGDVARIAAHILATVQERGKQHSSVTGSGGMFIGRVRERGSAFPHAVAIGRPIASLVSLTLTPLYLEEILEVDRKRGRLFVRGTAVLFASGLFAELPDDLPQSAALALFDVAGAPAQTARRARAGMDVAIVGADGKSGLLSALAAKLNGARVIALVQDRGARGARLLRDAQIADLVLEIDARDALSTLASLQSILPGLADLVINCVNVAGTELTTLMLTKDRGTAFFFSMATSFSAAALGAEGIGKDLEMLIGNGYAHGHAETALKTLRSDARIFAYFIEQYGT
jgi:L-erythro-3,5-diaminohexanoate dehydrogenase